MSDEMITAEKVKKTIREVTKGNKFRELLPFLKMMLKLLKKHGPMTQEQIKSHIEWEKK